MSFFILTFAVYGNLPRLPFSEVEKGRRGKYL